VFVFGRLAVLAGGVANAFRNAVSGRCRGFLAEDEVDEGAVWIHLDGSGRKGLDWRGFYDQLRH
jgi:hypothetical protein